MITASGTVRIESAISILCIIRIGIVLSAKGGLRGVRARHSTWGAGTGVNRELAFLDDSG